MNKPDRAKLGSHAVRSQRGWHPNPPGSRCSVASPVAAPTSIASIHQPKLFQQVKAHCTRTAWVICSCFRAHCPTLCTAMLAVPLPPAQSSCPSSLNISNAQYMTLERVNARRSGAWAARRGGSARPPETPAQVHARPDLGRWARKRMSCCCKIISMDPNQLFEQEGKGSGSWRAAFGRRASPRAPRCAYGAAACGAVCPRAADQKASNHISRVPYGPHSIKVSASAVWPWREWRKELGRALGGQGAAAARPRRPKRCAARRSARSVSLQGLFGRNQAARRAGPRPIWAEPNAPGRA
jgi:hypothetical protein